MGQWMTPDGIVAMILDGVGYAGRKILEKTIMEPSFGDGAFLRNIVVRVIGAGRDRGLNSECIARILNENIYGIEKDRSLYDKCIKKLNALLEAYEIPIISWNNLIFGDAITEHVRFLEKFDYCVGNPPFVRVHNIPQEYRSVVSNFRFSDGMRDLYVTFYEIGLKMLHEKGKLGFISANSFLKNTSQQAFRDYLVKSKYISAVYDFKTSKIFSDADTYTCICILNKNRKRADFSVDYREYQMFDLVERNRLSYEYFCESLLDKAWNLAGDDEIRFLEENKALPIKIQNIAIVQNGVATNRDAVYIVRAFCDKNLTKEYRGKHTDAQTVVYFHDGGRVHEIESTILHRCVKASKFNGQLTNTYIIFPYKASKEPKFYTPTGEKLTSEYKPVTEEELKTDFPKAYQYLLSKWDELITRDTDKGSVWFLFGRSQGIQNSCFKKIVFKHILSKKHPIVEPFVLEEDVIVYSGIFITIDRNICITPKFKDDGNKTAGTYIFNLDDYNFELKETEKVLRTPEFSKYCAIVGKDMAGGYVGVSAKMVKAFGTHLTDFPNFPVSLKLSDAEIADRHCLNNLFHQKFVQIIKQSHENMAKFGKTSSKRVSVFHGFLARLLQYKLGTDFDIYADGYSYGNEYIISGNFDNKKVDVAITKKGRIVGAVAFKLLANNFKQNNKNFIEAMLGEATQLRGLGVPYGFCYLIPEKSLHLGVGSRRQKFMSFDVLTQADIKVYYDIITDARYKNRTPDALFVGIHKLFKDEFLNNLRPGEMVDLSSEEYLNGIEPVWSDCNFIDDEEIRDYFLAENIGEFLDEFVKIILEKE